MPTSARSIRLTTMARRARTSRPQRAKLPQASKVQQSRHHPRERARKGHLLSARMRSFQQWQSARMQHVNVRTSLPWTSEQQRRHHQRDLVRPHCGSRPAPAQWLAAERRASLECRDHHQGHRHHQFRPRRTATTATCTCRAGRDGSARTAAHKRLDQNIHGRWRLMMAPCPAVPGSKCRTSCTTRTSEHPSMFSS